MYCTSARNVRRCGVPDWNLGFVQEGGHVELAKSCKVGYNDPTNYHSAEVYSSAELKNLKARYAAMCTLVSKHIGRVLRVIEDSGLLENTIVCFLSDHGIYLGERGLTGKSLIHADAFDCFPFHIELTRMCWMMYIPASLELKSVRPGTRYR